MIDEDLTRDEFSVYAFYFDGWYSDVIRFTGIENALKIAKRASEQKIGLLSRAERIIVTDGGDNTVFEWRRDEGITFPPSGDEDDALTSARGVVVGLAIMVPVWTLVALLIWGIVRWAS